MHANNVSGYGVPTTTTPTTQPAAKSASEPLGHRPSITSATSLTHSVPSMSTGGHSIGSPNPHFLKARVGQMPNMGRIKPAEKNYWSIAHITGANKMQEAVNATHYLLAVYGEDPSEFFGRVILPEDEARIRAGARESKGNNSPALTPQRAIFQEMHSSNGNAYYSPKTTNSLLGGLYKKIDSENEKFKKSLSAANSISEVIECVNNFNTAICPRVLDISELHIVRYNSINGRQIKSTDVYGYGEYLSKSLNDKLVTAVNDGKDFDETKRLVKEKLDASMDATFMNEARVSEICAPELQAFRDAIDRATNNDEVQGVINNIRDFFRHKDIFNVNARVAPTKEQRIDWLNRMHMSMHSKCAFEALAKSAYEKFRDSKDLDECKKLLITYCDNITSNIEVDSSAISHEINFSQENGLSTKAYKKAQNEAMITIETSFNALISWAHNTEELLKNNKSLPYSEFTKDGFLDEVKRNFTAALEAFRKTNTIFDDLIQENPGSMNIYEEKPVDLVRLIKNIEDLVGDPIVDYMEMAFTEIAQGPARKDASTIDILNDFISRLASCVDNKNVDGIRALLKMP
ncbi:hypothetical protein EO087_16000 [Dyella sp. M7H15-1]|uniref:hypothetical protein n=1 Tax=Dyella sp. M7H15-1 TaxID=2501295 RepID=UPI001004FBCF|nr:hypothetical protein [Dyella sp. M7H15-1]QAU25307.1 hypothetical protein EO087_16000 [Dyella sp. M7H15-1]